MDVCPRCQKPRPEVARFCPGCGFSFGEASPPPPVNDGDNHQGPLPVPSSPEPSLPDGTSSDSTLASGGSVAVVPPSSPDPLGDNATFFMDVPETPIPDATNLGGPLAGGDAHAEGAAIEREAEVSSPKPLSTLGSSNPQDVLAEQRTFIAENLLALIPFVQGEHKEANKELFERNFSTSPSIEDKSWEDIAYIAGVYGRFMGRNELSAPDKWRVWQALNWAVRFEYYHRQAQVVPRFNDLLKFLNGNVNDTAFLTFVLESVDYLFSHFDERMLQRLKETIQRHPNPETLDILLAKVDAAIAEAPPPVEVVKPSVEVVKPSGGGKVEKTDPSPSPSPESVPPRISEDLRPVFDIIKRRWTFLDGRQEKTNQERLEKASSDPRVARGNLATLAGVICRNAVYRYAHERNGEDTSLPDDQLQDALMMADFAARNSIRPDFSSLGRRYHFLLSGLQQLRTRTMKPTTFAAELKKNYSGGVQSDTVTPNAWSDLMGIVTRCFAERRRVGVLDKAGAQEWVQVLHDVSGVNEFERGQFEMEMQLHGALIDVEPPAPLPPLTSAVRLAFLTDEQRAELLDSIFDRRPSRMRPVLAMVRKQLLQALSEALRDPAFEQFVPPRHTISLPGNNGVDQFSDARRRLFNIDRRERSMAIPQFSRAVQIAHGQEEVRKAREWLLFARAQVDELFNVVPEWEADFKNGIASWEEIWNLAADAFRIGAPAQALALLKSGVASRQAPFSHLRFALFCAVYVIQDAERYAKEELAEATTFLCEHLAKLPLLEGYLTWLLLASESQDAANFKRQEPILRAFIETWKRPVELLRPESEDTIETFERDLKDLFEMIHKFEDRDRYALELKGDRLVVRSKMVETFLQMPEGPRKRVGIFVDYENLPKSLIQGMQTKEIGEALLCHAATYGEVVCSWACADPRNFMKEAANAMRLGLEEAGLRVRFPQGQTGVLATKEGRADFVVLERIDYEANHSAPEVYLIVSGDKDYYEKIRSLLEYGKDVHIVASLNDRHLAGEYPRLKAQSDGHQLPQAYGKFYIDNLDDILK